MLVLLDGWMVVRFVGVTRVPLCARVSCDACVSRLARCLFTGTDQPLPSVLRKGQLNRHTRYTHTRLASLDAPLWLVWIPSSALRDTR